MELTQGGSQLYKIAGKNLVCNETCLACDLDGNYLKEFVPIRKNELAKLLIGIEYFIICL